MREKTINDEGVYGYDDSRQEAIECEKQGDRNPLMFGEWVLDRVIP